MAEAAVFRRPLARRARMGAVDPQLDGFGRVHGVGPELGDQGLTGCLADAVLPALVAQSELVWRSLREIYLAPLGDGRQGEEARRTLRAYFRAGYNAAAAAAELGVAPKTVGRRIRAIERRLGRRLAACHAELVVALRVEELEGRGVGDRPLAGVPTHRHAQTAMR